MKAELSILLTSLRGAAGSVVASAWKGIKYFRERVIPANPRDPEQVDHRADFTKSVMWYHDLEQQVADYLKVLAIGKPVLGFNMWMERCLHDLHSWRVTKLQPIPPEIPLRLIPLTSPVNPIGSLTAETGPSPKEITLDWTAGEATPTHKLYILASIQAGAKPYNLTNNLIMIQSDTTPVSALTAIVAFPDSAVKYGIFVLVENTVTHAFSIARYVEGTSETG